MIVIIEYRQSHNKLLLGREDVMEQTELQVLLDKCGLSTGFIGLSLSHSSRVLESNSDIQTCASADTEY